TVLVAAVAEPLRLRGNDFALFARTRQAIGARLLALPPWLPQEIERDADDRADEAAFLLRGLRFAEARGEPGEDLRLVPTRKGTRWLAGSDRERLAALVDPLRKSPQRNPPSWYAEDREWDFFPLHFDLATSKSRWDLRSALTERFLSTPAEEWVPLDAFLEHARREANPFLARGVDRSGATRGGRLHGRAEWERLWGEMVRIFLFARLAPLGGVRLGRTAEGEFCFTLAEVGRYLLGAADTFEYGYTGEAEVVVQPNFEVVFLTPSPQLEAQLARFAERVGSGVGVLFRITRASVLAAAEAGGDAEGLLGTLRGASSRALPENVERQIRDWLAAVRRVTTRRVLLVECPDAETAARVHAASGGSIRPITPTVLEAPDSTSKARTALVRRLRKAGVFVAE
ncbi:MAG: helicase-associated domain-containing protein, partial [Gemmatimonadota bacterium]|nr:helicase-associated domain-containing protein [Gemmatimonadota bacterium]